MVTIYCEDDSDWEDDSDDYEYPRSHNGSTLGLCSPINGSDETAKPIHSLQTQEEETVQASEVLHEDAKVAENSNQPQSAVQTLASSQGDAKESTEDLELEKQRRTFVVHKTFATFYSSYFDRAFNGSFIEGQTQSITVKTTPKIFSILAGWLYRQSLQNTAGENPNHKQLIKLWILADELLMPNLQNDAIALFHKISASQSIIPKSERTLGTGLFKIEFLNSVWKKTTPGSPLRKIIVRNHACNATNKWFNIMPVSELPQDMMYELTVYLFKEFRNYPGDRASPIMKWVNLDIEEYFIELIKCRHKS